MSVRWNFPISNFAISDVLSMIEFKSDVRYAYSTGRIRVLETKLLSSSKVEKMIESPSISDAIIYLEDTAYDDTIGEMKEPEKYTELVKIERSTAFDLMERLIFDLEVKNLFRIPFDFHNMKVLLKGRLNEMEVTNTLSDFGTISVSVMKTAFDTDDFNPLPEFMRETIGQALAHHYLKKDLKSMEFLIDNLEYDYLLSLSRKTSVPFLINYVKTKIDLVNISTLLRVKYFDTDDNLEETLIEGGNLPTIFFLKLSGEPLESFPTFFRNSQYYKLIDIGVKNILKDGSFSILDRESENFIMNYIRLTRYLTFGVEPVAAYFVSREQDLNIIKMILVGKLNELPATEIRNRIPQTFN